jgi:hypothetical protein
LELPEVSAWNKNDRENSRCKKPFEPLFYTVKKQAEGAAQRRISQCSFQVNKKKI